MEILLKNGEIINEDGRKKADVLIKDGKISKIGENLESTGEVIDCSNRLLFPGFIDAHTHFDLSVAGTTTADDFESGTKASILGGTTTVLDFAHQYKGETLTEGVNNWMKKAEGKSSCDYGFHLAITDWNDEREKELEKIFEDGVTTFKLYTTYDVMVDDRDMFHILKKIKELGGLAGTHCENDGIVAALRDEVEKSGENSVACHYKTRPDTAEAEAVNRYIDIAEVVDTDVMVVHLTNKKALDVIRNARKHGRKVYAETCPQYLLMSQNLYDLPGFEGAKYVISPPLRTRDDQHALWEALANGEIQTIATDHCSFTLKQKEMGLNDYRKIPGGMPGVETRGTLIYTYGVLEHRITLEDMCRLLSTNPAKLYGMYPEKGVIKEGSIADITIINPEKKQVISKENDHSKCDYAPLEGTKLACTVEHVLLGGKHVVDEGKLVMENEGKYIKRKLPVKL